jgi:hypothetical protein
MINAYDNIVIDPSSLTLTRLKTTLRTKESAFPLEIEDQTFTVDTDYVITNIYINLFSGLV